MNYREPVSLHFDGKKICIRHRAKNFICPEKDNRDREALLDVEALDSLIAIYRIGASPAGLSLITVRRNLGADAGSYGTAQGQGDKERARSQRRDGRHIL